MWLQYIVPQNPILIIEAPVLSVGILDYRGSPLGFPVRSDAVYGGDIERNPKLGEATPQVANVSHAQATPMGL